MKNEYTLSLSAGDKVKLSAGFLAQEGYVAKKYENETGVVEEVITTWEPNDMICWDYHVVFPDGNVCGFYGGDLRRVENEQN